MKNTTSRVCRIFTLSLLLALVAGCGPQPPATPPASPDSAAVSASVDLRSIGAAITGRSALALRDALASGELRAAEVTAAYLNRIESLDDAGPQLHAIIEINPDARALAEALDGRFAQNGPVGPLHGVPVVLKANIDTADAMATSAGSIALADHHANRDAFLVSRLREAGAIILAKTNLSEWANFRDDNASSGWSSLGGQTRNPFVLDRNPCGSSSGSAVAIAADLAPLAVGTETDGSIVCPAGINGIVGIKPTLGLVSRGGIIPIAISQDTAGPMAADVLSAALLLETLAAADPGDPAAHSLPTPGFLPDTGKLRLDGLRIGVLREYFGVGTFPQLENVYQSAVDQLVELGAEIVDPVTLTRSDDARDAEFEVLLHEFKAGIADYLQQQGRPAGLGNLADLILYNDTHRDRVMPIFGQSVFLEAEARGDLTSDTYITALQASQQALRDAVNGLFQDLQIDALFHPVNGPAWKIDWVAGDRYSFGGTAYVAAVTGYPSVAIPAGLVAGLPIAVAFTGLADTDQQIIQMAWVLEQALGKRPQPRFIPTLETQR
ncbi:MAG: amidase [Pseudomonadales bacterium]